MKKSSKNKNYTQGIFHPNNPKKYKGTLPIFYRSSLEIKAMRWLDNNANVISWGSESVVIPYQAPDGKVRRYFVDLVCEIIRKDGTRQKILIEVKPEKQTKPPTISARKSQKTLLYEAYTWAVNQAKWDAAKKWCASKKMTFLVLTDKKLG